MSKDIKWEEERSDLEKAIEKAVYLSRSLRYRFDKAELKCEDLSDLGQTVERISRLYDIAKGIRI